MKLGTKLMLSLVAVTIVVMTIHGYLSIRQDRENLIEELRVGMRGLTRAVEAALEDVYGDERNLKATQELIDKIGPRGNIHGIVVYDAGGKRVAMSASLKEDFPELDPRPVLGIDPRPALEGAKGIQGYVPGAEQLVYYHIEPIFNSQRALAGALVLARQGHGRLAGTIEARRNRIAATSAALILLLSVLILIIVRRNVVRPIGELIGRIRSISGGHWDQRIALGQSEEIAALAEEFNALCERLEDSYSRLLAEQEEKLKLERDLRRSEKLASVGQLAAGLAHEIGTPLTIIGGRAEHLLRRSRSPEEITDSLRLIRSQIDRIAGIVRHLLAFARHKQPHFRRVEIAPLLAHVQALIQHQLDEKRAAVDLKLAEPLPEITADPDLLQQLFLNLYLNSLHAIGSGGTIKVRGELVDKAGPGAPARADGKALRLVVEDNGAGIAGDHLERVFDPFFTTKDVGEGTGLGLSVSYGIVKDHGGDIRVESESGSFTRFTIDLPLAPPSPGGSPEPRP